MNYDKQCRDAFVAEIKEENSMRDSIGKWSLRAHWAGPENGFADEMLQIRYRFFEKGWKAHAAMQASEPKEHQ